MISDVKKILDNKENFTTMQQVIRIDVMFNGYVIKDWFRVNVNTKKCNKNNKEIVKLCVQCYQKSWNERNKVMNKNVRRTCILEQFDNEVKKSRIHKSKNVRRHVQENKTNVRDIEANNMQKWLLGLNTVVECEKNHDGNSIHAYMR